ncbi:MAG: hypothetical protein H0X53_02645 [Sphingomonas sp.]|nr:hypothetical protein [Sphingomonas sp.]
MLLGLAVAELLLGFGNLLRAREQPRWGILTPMLGLLIFVHIISSFVDAWDKLQDVTVDLAGIAPPALIGVGYFIAALMAIPRDIEDWPSLDDYFHARKWLTLGPIISNNILTIIFFDFYGIMQNRLAAIVAYVLVNGLMLALLAIPLLTGNRRIAGASMFALILIMVILYATPLNISGLMDKILGI